MEITIELSVNIDRVATLKQAHGPPFWEPDPVATALACLQAGAGSIDSFKRIRKIKKLDMWGFTMGSAIFKKNLLQRKT